MDKPTPPKTITTRTLGTGPAVEFVFLTDAIAHGEAMAAWGAAQERERWLRSVGPAYGYLWCVNNEPGTPNQYPPERAAYEARRLLRELLTKVERGEFINTVVQILRPAQQGD